MFNYLKCYLKSKVNNQKGQAMVEYGLLVALIAVVVIAALVILGPKIAGLFENVAGNIA